jgi:hypothetical protein
MRKALNDNQMAQFAVIGVLLAAAALFLLGGMGKKSSDSGTTGAAAESGATAPPAPGAVPSQPPTAVAPTTDAAAAASSAAPTTALPTGTTGPPLPKALDAAYRDGDTIVLLVTRGGGIDDRLVRGSVSKLRKLPAVAVFTTNAKGVARYARITEAVDLDRVPALIVVEPRDLSSGATAEAQVEYGFRSTASVVQAVRDILYQGPTLGYAPN